MSFKKVKELRQAGKLEEAFQLAKEDLEAAMSGVSKPIEAIQWIPFGEVDSIRHADTNSIEPQKSEVTEEKREVSSKGSSLLQSFQESLPNQPNPTDVLWAKRSMAWVLYEYLKLYASAESFEAFLKYLNELAELKLPEDEKMVFDSIAWQMGKLLFDIHRQSNIDFSKVDTLFNLVKTFHFTKPSKPYTVLYKAFHKDYQNWSRYLEFADYWGFEHFLPEDYLKEEMPNGKPLMAVAEQAHIAYAKKLLEGEPMEADPFRNQVNLEKIKAFMPILDQLIDKHPEFLYPPYFKAKLLLALGSDENILESLLPFAKAKRNDFWVWDVLADIFPKDPEIQIACLCKALTCRTKNEFLINVRTKLTGLLIDDGKYAEARTEIDQIIKTRQEKGWSITGSIKNWQGATWYQETIPLVNNRKLYDSYANKADEVLFADLPVEVAVVEYVNRDRKILNFIVSQDKYGHLKYDRFLRNVDIGDRIEVRLEGPSGDGFFKAITLNKTEREPEATILKTFAGIMTIRPGNVFGFVDDVFVEPDLIKRFKLVDDDFIAGKALRSFNKKKNSWGWKVMEVNRI